MNGIVSKEEGIYEYTNSQQLCPVCKEMIGIIPGSRDAVCHNCGYKDPCCE